MVKARHRLGCASYDERECNCRVVIHCGCGYPINHCGKQVKGVGPACLREVELSRVQSSSSSPVPEANEVRSVATAP